MQEITRPRINIMMAELSEKSPDYERQNTEDVADLPLKIPVSVVVAIGIIFSKLGFMAWG